MVTVKSLQARYSEYHQQQQFNQEPQHLYAPVNYILGLGGKRLRPVMLLMACNIFREEIDAALPAAFAVEIFHNFTLLHDDIMDDAPLRRGHQTVHTLYDVNTGILSGDVMLIYAYQYLGQVAYAQPQRLLEIFNAVAIGVCEGQQFDMDFENQSTVSIEAYINMIRLKTAVLLAGGMQMGALIGGASATEAQHIYDFGLNVGIAFQLQDDILDTFGDPAKFGKKVGGDIVQNKKTYLVLKALELADSATAAELNSLMNTPTTDEAAKIAMVKNLFNQLQVREAAEVVQNDYLQRAHAALDALNVTPDRLSNLRQLADQLMGREV